MDTTQKLITMEMKAKLSTLWIFVILNIIVRDIHEFFRPGLLEQILAGVVNGTQTTDGVLLAGGMVMEILLVMVLLSRILPYSLNRWTNIVVSVVAMVYVITSGPKDLDDTFFAAIEVVALALIVWFAWTWPAPEASAHKKLANRVSDVTKS